VRVLINITSYNRKEMLVNLINQLYGFDIIVWDDNSNFDMSGNFIFHKFDINHGKKLAWVKFQKIFKLMPKEYDYYIFLPDDSVLIDNFVNKAVELWNGIQDNNKICLSFSTKERISKSCFTAKEPIDKGNVVLTQWNDLCFISGREFIDKVVIDPVDPKRWDENENLSSGVGSKISHFFYKYYNLYHAKEEMVKHVGLKSLMNPAEREINPL